MNRLSWLSLLLIFGFDLAACAPVNPTIQPAQRTQHPSLMTASTLPVSTLTPTETVRPPTVTPSRTVTLTPFDTLEPAQVTQTLQPLIKEPMNCTVPCFWGIIPEKTHMDEVRTFFGELGFTPFEGTYNELFYTITSSGDSVTFSIQNNLVENIVIDPHIPESKEGSLHEWTSYSPETLIKRYGEPLHVQFGVNLQERIGIGMTMYFDTVDLIASYSGYDMDPWSFCPPTAAFNHVRLWMGPNPPDAPSLNPTSYKALPLEKATSLTMDQFTKLMLGNPKKACFKVNLEAFLQ